VSGAWTSAPPCSRKPHGAPGEPRRSTTSKSWCCWPTMLLQGACTQSRLDFRAGYINRRPLWREDARERVVRARCRTTRHCRAGARVRRSGTLAGFQPPSGRVGLALLPPRGRGGFSRLPRPWPARGACSACNTPARAHPEPRWGVHVVYGGCYSYDSIRLRFDCYSTAMWPSYDHSTLRPTYLWAVALRPK